MNLLLRYAVLEVVAPQRLCLRLCNGATYFGDRWMCCARNTDGELTHYVPGFATQLRKVHRRFGTQLYELIGDLFCQNPWFIDCMVIKIAVDYVYAHQLAPQYAAGDAIRCVLRAIGNRTKYQKLLHCAIVHRYVVYSAYRDNGPRALLVTAIYQQLQLPFYYSGYYPLPIHRFPEVNVAHVTLSSAFDNTSLFAFPRWVTSLPVDTLYAKVLVWLSVERHAVYLGAVYWNLSRLHRMIAFWAWHYENLVLRIAARRICDKIMLQALTCKEMYVE